MSDSAHRSFEGISSEDLRHLGRLAVDNFDHFFSNNPAHPYQRRLRLICLLQSAAKHYVEPDDCIDPLQRHGGVNDFDVCGFFEAVVGRKLYAQRKANADFGESKFGRNPEEASWIRGRRVDILWRSIPMPFADPVASVAAYLKNAKLHSSASCWATKPAVVIWPNETLGQIIPRTETP